MNRRIRPEHVGAGAGKVHARRPPGPDSKSRKPVAETRTMIRLGGKRRAGRAGSGLKPRTAYPQSPARQVWGLRVLHQGTKAKVYDKLLSSLGAARQGKRELDIIVSFVLGDTTSEAGKMIQLLVEEGYPWDVISELLDEDLPAYTTSLDAALPGENVVLSAYAKKRKKWVAVQRMRGGEQISAWAATECLARRLAGLMARKAALPRAAGRPNGTQARPGKSEPHGAASDTAAPGAVATRQLAGEGETDGGSEWRILF